MEVLERIRGSLLAGALGDAFGAPVERYKLPELKEKFGPEGVRDLLPYDPADYKDWGAGEKSGFGVVTDDTCMLVAMLAGLVTAYQDKGVQAAEHIPHYLHQAFLRWGQHQVWMADADGCYLDTQIKSHIDTAVVWPVWSDHFCFKSGAGKSTLAALRLGRIGSIERPLYIPSPQAGKPDMLNGGCGGMMRVAPVGWMAALGFVEDAYELGCRSAAITQGEAYAQTASGALAILIAGLAAGNGWESATHIMLQRLKGDPRAQDTYEWSRRALDEGTRLGNAIHFEDVEALPYKLGVIEQGTRRKLFLAPAVLIQVMAITSAAQQWPEESGRMRRAATLAVTQSGDSDSVAAISGNIIGAQFGEAALPKEWMSQLQCLPSLNQLIDDLAVLTVKARNRPNISATAAGPSIT